MATEEIRVRYNDKVKLTDGGQGTVKYIGEVIGKEGVFYGIDLIKGSGKNNGTHKGQLYFKTRGNNKSGKFVKNILFKKVTKTKFSTEFTVGDSVFIKSKGNGIIKFVGIPSFSKVPKPMYGVQLNESKGICDGTFKKAKYFSCAAKYGIYVVQNKVSAVKALKQQKTTTTNTNNNEKKMKKSKSKKRVIIAVDPDTDDIKNENENDSNNITIDIAPKTFKTKRKWKRKIRKQRFSDSVSSMKSNASNPISHVPKSFANQRMSKRISKRLSRVNGDVTKIAIALSQLTVDAYKNNRNVAMFGNNSPSGSNVSVESEESLFDGTSDSESQICQELIDFAVDAELVKHGYENVRTVYNTFQFELICADTENSKVIIKKIVNTLNDENSNESDDTVDDEHDDEIDLVKEALILEYLTVDNQCHNNYIVKFIDFFESEKYVYLTTHDYMTNNMNLYQFVNKAHKYIENEKLKLKEYQKIIKYVLWQICITLYWLHNDMSVCHLDIQPKNIYLIGAQFILSNEYVTINPSISIQLIGFGRSELFQNNTFICDKGPSLDFIEYVSPEVYNGNIYNARKSDVWSLGIMCYFCYVGNPLFVAFDDDDSEQKEYWSPQSNTLKEYVHLHNLKRFINTKIIDFLGNILKINENQRFEIKNIIKHQWFESYYKKYKDQIIRKSKTQKLKLKKQKDKLDSFPYFQLMPEPETPQTPITPDNISENENT